MASWESVALPQFKGVTGWEFTELKGFDLAAYPTATAGELVDVEPIFEAPQGGVELRQADHGWERMDSPGGVLIMPLTQAVEEHGELVDRYLGTVVRAEENAFVARNASEWEGGAFVYVPRDTKLDAPVLLDVLQTQENTALNWRVLIVLEESAEGVRIMTVHTAKGLEFPVVILADLTTRLSRQEPDLYVDTRQGVCATALVGCAPWDLLDHQPDEALRDRAEGMRVCYVAATRARDLLVVPAVGDEPLAESWLEPLHKARRRYLRGLHRERRVHARLRAARAG